MNSFELFVVASSIWVYVDASRIGARRGLGVGRIANVGPGQWFAISLLLWIIGFPLYLSKRWQIQSRVNTIRQWGFVPFLQHGMRCAAKFNDNMIYWGTVMEVDLQNGFALIQFDKGTTKWIGSMMIQEIL